MAEEKVAAAPPRRGPMGGGQGGSGEKPKNFKRSIGRMLKEFKPFLAGMIFIFLMAVGAGVLSIMTPKILSNATNALFAAFTPGAGGVIPGLASQQPFIFKILIICISLYVSSSLLSVLSNVIMAGIAQKIVYNMRRKMSNKLTKIPLKFYDAHTHGEILSRITNDMDTISMTLSQSAIQMVQGTITVVGAVIMMATTNGWMLLIALAILPISLVFIMLVTKRSQKYFRANQQRLGELNGHIEEIYSGHKIVKAYSYEPVAKEQFDVTNKQLTAVGWKSQFFGGLMQPIMNFVSNLGYIAISLLGMVFATKGIIDPGTVIMFTQYSSQFTNQLAQMSQLISTLQSAAAASERVYELMDEEEQTPDKSEIQVVVGNVVQRTEELLSGNAQESVQNIAASIADMAGAISLGTATNKLPEDITGEITFDHVSFGYTPERTLIKDMNIRIKPGQIAAIVGPTGAGKTTIVNLLMRFYDLNSGTIRIDGVDIADVAREDVRKNIGMVLQDTWLFSGSIADNISYSRQDATREEIKDAAYKAQAHRFIKTLPQGYDTPINEEASNISQGQKQLLTIARALLADPAILILDEATSSVDTMTELHIQQAMAELMKGRTSFVIAHRLSTIKDADVILVMKDGDIIEHGNHIELIKAKGFYNDLYNSQFAK